MLPVDALLWLVYESGASEAVPYVRLLRLVQALRLVRYLGRADLGLEHEEM